MIASSSASTPQSTMTRSQLIEELGRLQHRVHELEQTLVEKDPGGKVHAPGGAIQKAFLEGASFAATEYATHGQAVDPNAPATE